MKKTLLLSLIGISLIAKETFTLEEQTVTATNIETDELRYAAAVEIYNKEDIENSKSQNIYEFLNQETSVITMPSFGNEFAQKIDMRGYGINDGYQNIVVVVNGRRMNNIDLVPQLLSSIPIDSIEKIEILKGAGSVEYGDGANAGVINITTKDFNGVNFKAYGGRFDTGYGSFGAGYTDDLFSLSAYGDYYETRGQRDLNLDDDKDSARSKTGAFDLKLYPLDTLELRVGWAATRIKTNYAGSLTRNEYKDDPTQASSSSDNLQFFDTDLWSFGLTYDLTNNFSIDTNLNIEDKESKYSTIGFKSLAEYDYNSGDLSLKYKNDDLQVVVGAYFFNGQRRTDADFTVENETSKDNLAGFIKLNYAFGDHSFTAGARLEKVDYQYKAVDGSNLSDDHNLEAYELGYNYKISNEQSIFISYASTFQAPDIDRFFSTTYPAPTYSPVIDFNGFINPMKTDTYNIGYNYFLKNNKLKVSAFYIDLSDEIYYDSINFTNTNLDETSKIGFEIYDKYIIMDNLYVSANYTYIEAKIDEDSNKNIKHKTLPGVSKHNLHASIGYSPIEGSKIILSHSYRSSAYALNDFTNSFYQKQEAYNSTDISVSYQVQDNIEVFAKIQNLFDEDNGIWIQDDAIYPVNFQMNFQVGLVGKF